MDLNFAKRTRSTPLRMAGLLAAATIFLAESPKLRAEDESVVTNGVPLHGFADAGWAMDNQKDPPRRGYARGVYLDNVDLYLAPDLGSRVRFLTEIALEPSFDDQGIGIDTERLQVGYVFSNLLTAWVGRFHTPIGGYIIAYHHGALLQTAVEKPRFLDFEDHYGVVPVHTTGIWLSGNALIGDDRLGYMGWVGNGDQLTPEGHLDMNMFHDDNHDTTFGARLTYFFGGALDGLQAGVAGDSQRVDAAKGTVNTGGAPVSVRLNIVAAHVDYEAHGFEWLNEFWGFGNRDLTVDASKLKWSHAAFSQFGYWISGTMSPYVRYEKGVFNLADPFFTAQLNGAPYSREAVGFRYNLGDSAAVKIELNRTHINADTLSTSSGVFNQIRTQYAVRF